MNFAATLVSFLASTIAIITAIGFAARYIARRFDKWIERVVENTGAIRSLSARVSKLEGTIRNNANLPTESPSE